MLITSLGLLVILIFCGAFAHSDQSVWSIKVFAFSILAVLCWLYFATFIFSAHHLSIDFFETDFVDYCIATLRFDHLRESFPSRRSRFPAFFPGLLSAKFGIIDALAIQSLFMMGVVAWVLFAWGFSIGGIHAGIFSLFIGLSMTPLVSMTRYLSFYPTLIAIFSVAGWLFYRAWNQRNWSTCLMAGAGIGCCLVVDVRGLVWAVCWFFPLFLLVLLMNAKWKSKIICLLALLVPIWLSWFVGWWAYAPNTFSLGEQMDVRPLFAVIDPSNAAYADQTTMPSFVWGYGGDALGMIGAIIEQLSLPKPVGLQQIDSLENQIWLCFGLACLLLLFALLESRKFFGLLIAVFPFFLALWGAVNLVESHVRFPAQGLFAVALVAGVLAGKIGQRFPIVILKGGVGGIVSVALWGALIWGYIPSAYHPNAAWKDEYPVQRKLLYDTLSQSFPNQNFSDVGSETHLIPQLIEERSNATTWPQECAKQLGADGKTKPSFY